MEDLAGVIFRISIIYLYVLAILRLSGKRSIGDLSPMDFVVATIIGDMFDDVIWAEIPLSQGVVGITTIVSLHILVAYAGYKSDWLHALIASKKTAVVRYGKYIHEGLRLERTRSDEVRSEIRLQSEENLQEVREANWEPSGQVSVLKREDAKPVQKKDLPLLKEMFR